MALGKFSVILHRITSFIKYWLKAKDEHSVHSPFVFQLYTNCIQAKDQYYIFKDIETIREGLLQNQSMIQSQNPGAGQSFNSKNSIARLAKHSLSSAEQMQTIFRLASFLKPKNVIELGTSLGISGAYLASFSKQHTFHTWDANPELINIAKNIHKKLKLDNIVYHNDNIDTSLPEFLKNSSDKIDLVFIDANHTFDASIQYVNWLLPHLSDNSLVIIDDIYWSSEMTKAWQELQSKKDFTVSIDLYDMGLLFTRKEQLKQAFCLKK